jgi:hypothetical protein
MSDRYERYGGVSNPKIKAYSVSTGFTRNTNYASTASYESMPENMRWFRQDELVRRCIVINAAFASMAAGFQTQLELFKKSGNAAADEAALKDFEYVKEFVDAVNAKVNLDEVLFVAQIKRSIFGRAGFDIVSEPNGAPIWLLSLESLKLEPKINEVSWVLEGFKYNGEDLYEADEVLYFTNLQLENDYLGLSDVEPIVPVCRARHYLLKDDFPQITQKLWAPYTILCADTSSMTEQAEDAFLIDLAKKARAGESLAINKSVAAQVVGMDINLTGLVAVMDKLEETILRAFGTPRFLVNKTPENRATAFVEFEAFISGPISNIQKYFSRILEKSWYPQLVKLALKTKSYEGEVPVRIKQVWKSIRTADVNEMATSVAALYGNGLGILSEHEDIAFEMMGWPKEKLQQVTTEPNNSQNQNKKSLPGQETISKNGN